jgi:hypothetical protein
VHLATDTATSDIRAAEFTPNSDDDSPVLPELLDQIPEGEVIGTVTAHCAYDTRRCNEANMRCLKAFGERISAKDPDRQTAEIQIRVALTNRFSALGTDKVDRVA